MTLIGALNILQTILISIAAIVAPIAAWLGLKSWRHELKGRADFELARGLMRAVYKVRNNVETCRHPLRSIGEYPTKYQSRDPSNSEEKAELYAYIFQNRWRPVHDSIQELNVQSLEAEVLWGSDIKLKMDELYNCLGRLNVAMKEFIDNEKSNGETFRENQDFGKEIIAIVFAVKNSENKFSKRLEHAISSIEDEVRPYLKRYQQKNKTGFSLWG